MLIFLSTIFGDSDGLIKFRINNRNSSPERSSARVQVNKLLDGTTYVQSHAISEGDRQIEITSLYSQDHSVVDNIWRLYRMNTKFLLSVRGEFYLGVIRSLDTNRGFISFIFVPEQKF